MWINFHRSISDLFESEEELKIRENSGAWINVSVDNSLVVTGCATRLNYITNWVCSSFVINNLLILNNKVGAWKFFTAQTINILMRPLWKRFCINGNSTFGKFYQIFIPSHYAERLFLPPIFADGYFYIYEPSRNERTTFAFGGMGNGDLSDILSISRGIFKWVEQQQVVNPFFRDPPVWFEVARVKGDFLGENLGPPPSPNV